MQGSALHIWQVCSQGRAEAQEEGGTRREEHKTQQAEVNVYGWHSPSISSLP